MLENLCSDILGYLKLCFDIETANTIFSLACINFTEGLTALKNYKKIYDYSYLSERFPNIHISKNTLSLFLEDLGSKLNPTYKFYDLMIEKSSKNYAIDGHVIPSFSKENDLTKFGNKYSKIDSKQMNLLALFDVITKQPIMSKIYDGSQLDKTSVKEFLTLRPIENTLIIMDSGFFSKENIELFSTNSNSYIIPLSENYIDYKEAVKELKYDGDFVYESCEKDKKLINYYIHKQSSGVSIYVFQDKQLADKLKIEYLSCIKNNIKGYSDEKLKEIEKTLGVIVLQTNSESLTFKEIFEFYKKR
jgi:transposase